MMKIIKGEIVIEDKVSKLVIQMSSFLCISHAESDTVSAQLLYNVSATLDAKYFSFIVEMKVQFKISGSE